MGLTQVQKDKSRQIQLYAMLALMFIMVLGSMALVYVDKDVSGLSGVFGGGFVALATAMGANYFTKPKGDE